MTKGLIIKYLNNQCNEAELDEVIRWINSDELSEVLMELGYQQWQIYQPDEKALDDKKLSDLFDRIQDKIDQQTLKMEYQPLKGSNFAGILTVITRAAAILLIPVLAVLWNVLSEKKVITDQYAMMAFDSLEIVAPIGSRTVVELTDGSKVYLNYGSKLKYPLVFAGESRDVVLTGEGFFNVKHNPDKPFIVRAGKLNVKALGTSFNVNAYPDQENIETTLVTGKVVIEKYGSNGSSKTIGSLIPGQQVSFNSRTEALSSSLVKVEKFIAWTHGKVIFEDAAAAYVADRLSRMFNVDIVVNDKAKDYLYTFTFMDEPLYQILDLMTLATPVTYKISPRKKLPDGTFSKQRITIDKR